jgi:TetR/AcrR family acrAB operon transcriptional repressor
MARRTKEEALETRNAILDAAELAFNERGVSRTSLDDIARAAGVTRGAIYWHFANKAELLDAMLGRVTLPMEEMVARSEERAATDPLGYIRECMETVLLKVATDARTRRVFEIVTHKCEYVEEMSAVRDRYVEMRADCLDQLVGGFRNAVRRGALPDSVDPRIAAVGLHALVDGLVCNWIVEPGYFPLAKEAGRIVDTYLEGIKATAAKGSAPRHRKPAQRPRAETRSGTAARSDARSAARASATARRRR